MVDTKQPEEKVDVKNKKQKEEQKEEELVIIIDMKI